MDNQGNPNANANAIDHANGSGYITRALCDAKMGALAMSISETQRRMNELRSDMALEMAKADKEHQALGSNLKEDMEQRIALYEAKSDRTLSSIKSTIVGATAATTFILSALMYIFMFLKG